MSYDLTLWSKKKINPSDIKYVAESVVGKPFELNGDKNDWQLSVETAESYITLQYENLSKEEIDETIDEINNGGLIRDKLGDRVYMLSVHTSYSCTPTIQKAFDVLKALSRKFGGLVGDCQGDWVLSDDELDGVDYVKEEADWKRQQEEAKKEADEEVSKYTTEMTAWFRKNLVQLWLSLGGLILGIGGFVGLFYVYYALDLELLMFVSLVPLIGGGIAGVAIFFVLQIRLKQKKEYKKFERQLAQQREQQSKLEVKPLTKEQEENEKQAWVDYAFDKLLKRDRDYTVTVEVKSAVLVKKLVKWINYTNNTHGGGGRNGYFYITTDIKTFAFQVKDDEIIMVDVELMKAIFPKIKPAK